MIKVLCNGCTRCCRNDAFVVDPAHDDPDMYDTRPTRHSVPGEVMTALRLKPNGDCIYLDAEKGCTIHGRQPHIRKQFDCRRFYLDFHRYYTHAERQAMLKAKVVDADVLEECKKRLHTLDADANSRR